MKLGGLGAWLVLHKKVARCPTVKYDSFIKTQDKPAKSGTWRKCHLQKFLECAKIGLKRQDKNLEDLDFFPDISGYFWKYLTKEKCGSES